MDISISIIKFNIASNDLETNCVNLYVCIIDQAHILRGIWLIDYTDFANYEHNICLQIDVRWNVMLKRFKISKPRPPKDWGASPPKVLQNDSEMPPKDSVWRANVRSEQGKDSSNWCGWYRPGEPTLILFPSGKAVLLLQGFIIS